MFTKLFTQQLLLVMLHITGKRVGNTKIGEGGPTECGVVRPRPLAVVDDVIYIGDDAFVLTLPYCE